MKPYKKNKVIDIFIILLFTFQITISILVLIDRISYEYNEFEHKDSLFPIEDFIEEKYYATNSIFWGTLKANYEWTSFLGYLIRPIAILLGIKKHLSNHNTSTILQNTNSQPY